MEGDLLLLIFVSGLLGAFIGLERDVPQKKSTSLNGTADSFGGIRTFSIIAILGTLTAWLDSNFSMDYMLLSTLFIVAFFIAISHIYAVFKNKSVGVTSELAGIVTFFIGASCVLVDLKFPVIFTVLISVLLASKTLFEKFVSSISREELAHTMKFAVVSLVILPLLPDEKYSFASILNSFGISGVMDINNNIFQMQFFNPYSVWFFVVAISAIGYIGYILSRFLGKNSSIVISSFVGGLVSSTAVTAAMSEQSKKDPKNYHIYVLGTLLANSIMLLRVIIIVLIINFALIGTIFIPAFLMFLGLFVFTIYFYLKSKKIGLVKNVDLEGKVESPFSLKPAIKFGLFVLFLKFLAGIGVLYKDIWGESVFYYAFGIISGFADVDAITQTMTVQAKDALVSSSIAVSTILLAVMSNNTVKGLIAFKFGDKVFGKYVVFAFLTSILLGISGIIYIS
ncbi:MAG: DUF4010 domain-containing protein [Candidatus Gracilibacteria bacterium]|nr:DUF4010 domain-containing protein [Candidatus Gracilibacteria bacterium]